MTITDTRVKLHEDGPLLAFAEVTFEDKFVVRNMKIVRGLNGAPMLRMPERKMKDGQFTDVCFPLNAEFRGVLEKAIFAEYRKQKEIVNGAVPK